MSDTERTTAALSSATPVYETSSTNAKRRKVWHLFMVDAMEFAAEAGVDMRSLCGVWESPAPAREEDVIPVADGYPLFEGQDCKRCTRVYAAKVRSWREARA